jgi:spore coat polysaccharide biosynthesis protein SpsF
MSMRVGAVVQARMTSRRLPGKVLAPLAGRPALVWLLERLERAEGLDGVVVATSDDATDDPVAAFCAEQRTPVFRGPLEDVAGRMLQAARAHGFEALVRLSGDSPLLDQRLVSHAAGLVRETGADLVTNVQPRTFPPGQSVEVLTAEALARALGGMSPEEREHVTGPLYQADIRIVRFAADPPRIDVRLTLDTAEDHARLEAILVAMRRPHWEYGWEDVLALHAAGAVA